MLCWEEETGILGYQVPGAACNTMSFKSHWALWNERHPHLPMRNIGLNNLSTLVTGKTGIQKIYKILKPMFFSLLHAEF